MKVWVNQRRIDVGISNDSGVFEDTVFDVRYSAQDELTREHSVLIETWPLYLRGWILFEEKILQYLFTKARFWSEICSFDLYSEIISNAIVITIATNNADMVCLFYPRLVKQAKQQNVSNRKRKTTVTSISHAITSSMM